MKRRYSLYISPLFSHPNTKITQLFLNVLHKNTRTFFCRKIPIETCAVYMCLISKYKYKTWFDTNSIPSRRILGEWFGNNPGTALSWNKLISKFILYVGCVVRIIFYCFTFEIALQRVAAAKLCLVKTCSLFGLCQFVDLKPSLRN